MVLVTTTTATLYTRQNSSSMGLPWLTTSTTALLTDLMQQVPLMHFLHIIKSVRLPSHSYQN